MKRTDKNINHFLDLPSLAKAVYFLRPLNDEELFYKIKVLRKRTESGCLNYLGCLDKNGYGLVRHNGKNLKAHRLIYELTYKVKLKNTQFICHTCDNPTCINLKHLFLGDAFSNMKDMAIKKRGFHQKKTHCPHGHPYDDKNTVITKHGRACRECNKIICKKRYYMIKALKPPPGPHWRTLITHCKNGHEFTKDNTYIWNGYRKCRECVRARTKKQ